MRLLFKAFTAIILVGLTISQARADDVADFYKGKRINLIVAYGTGGGYDVYARLLARHMGRYLPGNPSFVVQNMPGAGSMRATNFLYNVAPRDGTTIATFARNVALLGLIKTSQNVQFDPLRFTWLGSASSFANDAYILLVRKDAKVQSIEDARRPGGPPLVLGSSAEGASSDASGIMLRDLLGFNVKLIPGYADSGMLFVAIERGEIDGRAVALSAVRANRPDWLKPGGPARVLLAFGRDTRHPDFPDVPTAREIAPTATDRALIEVMDAPYKLSRPFAAPPDVPPERARALQEAFMATQKDPAYLADAQRLGIDVSPIGGDEIVHLIERISKLPADELKRVEKLINQSG